MAEGLHLLPRHRKEVVALLHKHLPGVEVWAYGSRVNGRSHDGSDLDLVLRGPKLAEIDTSRLTDFIEALQDSTIPFLVEARDWTRLPESFHREIDREHVVLVVADQDDRPERKPRGSRPSLPASRSLGMEGNTRPFGELFAELTRNGLTRPKAVRGSGVKMVNMGELFAYPRLCNVPMDRVPLSQSEAERSLLEDGDLLFARQSLVLEGAGKCSIFLRDDEPVTFESHITRVRLDQKKAHPGYYFYYLQSHEGQSAIRSIVEQGAGASGIRASDLATLEVQWRPLPEQRAIAHILGTLDDKIELNRRMNETLEQMARALFKSWFVDFEPVHAKMEGRDTGLPKHLADLFPDQLVDSELGEIPEGWEVGALGNVLRQRVERCLASKETASRPYVPIDCITPRSLFLTESKPGEEAKSSLTKFYTGDLIFGAMRPYYHKVCIAPFDGTTRTTAFVLYPKRKHDFAFATLLLHDPDTIDFATRNSTGSTIPYAVWTDSMEAMATIIPTSGVLKAFDNTVRPFLMRIPQPYYESRTLAELRNALLPKLILGDLRVKKGAAFFEGLT